MSSLGRLALVSKGREVVVMTFSKKSNLAQQKLGLIKGVVLIDHTLNGICDVLYGMYLNNAVSYSVTECSRTA